MCDPVTATIGAALITATGSAVMGNQQRIAQERAQGAARADAERQARAAETLANADKQKAKRPDMAEALYGPPKSAAGMGSTSLTGPSGVELGSLNLGKNTLLGQ